MADPVDDLAIDLDDRRAQGGDECKAGIAGAGVVHREPEPELAEGLHLALEHPDVGDRLLLRALDGDLARVQPDGAHLGAEPGRLERGVEQAERGQVDRETS